MKGIILVMVAAKVMKIFRAIVAVISKLLIIYCARPFFFSVATTVHAAQTTSIAEKNALLSIMSQCLMVWKTKFQHSVTTTFFFARFSVKALSL